MVTFPDPCGCKRNGELVALADSTLLRFMQELQGVANRAERIYTLKTKLRALRQSPSSPAVRREIQQAYDRLDQLQFQPDYLCLVMDSIDRITTGQTKVLPSMGFHLCGCLAQTGV